MSWPQETMDWYQYQSHENTESPFKAGTHGPAYLTQTSQYMAHEEYLLPPNDQWHPQVDSYMAELDAPPGRLRTALYPNAIDFAQTLGPDFHMLKNTSYSSTDTSVSKCDSLSPRNSEEPGLGEDASRTFIPVTSAASMLYASPTMSHGSVECHSVTPSDVQQLPDALPDENVLLPSISDLTRMTEQPDVETTGIPTPSDTILSGPEADQEMAIDAESDCQDTSGDYKPSTRKQASRKKSRPNSSAKTSSGHKRKVSQGNKVAKTSSKPVAATTTAAKKAASASTTNLKCSQCGLEQSSKVAHDKHVQTAHARPFACIFEPYGCKSTFGAKNEWKRHCSTQHLRLSFYRCDVGGCMPKNPQEHKHLPGWDLPIASQAGCNDFNRKDLFVQHHRRMHAPKGIDDATQAEKDRFKVHCERAAQRCLVSARAPPPRTICGLCESKGCPVIFEGARAWETRMEHVGRHLENDKGDQNEKLEWAEDLDLRQWLIDEGLLKQSSNGDWMLKDHIRSEDARPSRR